MFNLCGHGHFDMQAYKDYLENNLAEDYVLWVELLQKWELHILDEVLMQVRDLPDGLRFKEECRVS